MKINKNLFRTYFIYFIVILLFVGIRILSSIGAFSFIKIDALKDYTATLLIQVVIMGIVPIMLYKLFTKKSFKQIFKDFGFKKISFKAVLYCVLIGILVYIVNIYVASIFSYILSIFGYSTGGSSASGETNISILGFIVSTIFVAVFPGIFEEITHRGMLMRGVANTLGYKKAIVISSIMFGLMHLNVSQCFYATFIGLIIGFVASSSGSIFPAMILHFMNNFMNVYVSYAVSGNWLGGKLINSISNSIYNLGGVLGTLVTILFLIFVVISLVILIIKLFKETRYKEFSMSVINMATNIHNTTIEDLTDSQLESTFKDYIMPYIENYSITDCLLPKGENEVKKTNLETNVFAICTYFMGILITIFTFLWGII